MNRKNIWAKTVVFAMILGMLPGILTGCSRDSEKKKQQDTDSHGKGGYVEKEIVLPENAGIPVGIIYQDHKPVLYTRSSSDNSCLSYTYEGNQWSEPRKETWLTDAANHLNLNIVDVFSGKDGNLYSLTASSEGSHLITSGEDGTAKDVTPVDKAEDSMSFYTDAAVLKDGTIALANQATGMVELYQNGSLAFTTEGIQAQEEEQVVLETNGQTLGLIGKDAQSIEFYHTDTYEKKNTVKLEQKSENGFILPGSGEIWYLVNSNGIYRITESGSISECIMDGSNGLMSNTTTWFMRKFIAGDSEEFYGLYSSSNQEWKLMQYVFDKEAATIPETTLSVYSLKENKTVRQSIYEFKNKHPEVKIEYLTAVTDKEELTTDHIRTLNTELLSGSGADVLILDDLPINSYIDKGVLLDLTETADRLRKAGVLESVIQNTAQKDGKIYAVPARINIPVIFGTDKEVKACESLESLKSYAGTYPDQRLFGAGEHDMIGMTLFHMFYEELQEINGGLKEEKLAELLSVWSQICENGNLRSYEKKYWDRDNPVWKELDVSFCTSESIFGETSYASIKELKGLYFSQDAFTDAEKTGVPLKSFKEYYVPKTIAGVNASSRYPQLAQEFIECLFTETVQKTDSWDGFPVLSSVLDTYPDYVESKKGKMDSVRFIGTNFETGEPFEEVVTYPSKEKTIEFLSWMKKLQVPFIEDPSVSETVFQEMEKCYRQEQTPEETAHIICQKVDLYLSE